MEEDDEQVWEMGVGLSIGLGDEYYYYYYAPNKEEVKNKHVAAACLDLSFPLYPKDEEELAMPMPMDHHHISELYNKTTEGIFSSNTNTTTSLEEEDQNDGNGNGNGIGINKHKNCSRKKLRLAKEQTSMLEDSFKMHTTLNTVQKQALAQRLNLKPRQVEVWFQNRRARSKLKQTEVEFGFLKKCCENLSEENQRLKKEIQELAVF